MKRGVVLAIALLAAGCAGVQHVEGTLTRPAVLPLRAVSSLVVEHDLDPEAELVAEGLVTALGTDRARMQPRGTGGGAHDTAVLSLSLRFAASVRTEWMTRPETVCGYYGCYSRQVSYPMDVPVLVAELVARVSRDGAALGTATARADAMGSDDPARRRGLARELLAQALAWLDVSIERVDVDLLRVDAPEVRAALDAIDDDDWSRGRAGLEAFVAGPVFASLPPRDRARVLYDLSLARRFDPASEIEPTTAFESAIEALEEAQRLDPRERYTDALADLRAHYVQARVLAEQRRGGVAANVSPAAATIRVPASYGP